MADVRRATRVSSGYSRIARTTRRVSSGTDADPIINYKYKVKIKPLSCLDSRLLATSSLSTHSRQDYTGSTNTMLNKAIKQF